MEQVDRVVVERSGTVNGGVVHDRVELAGGGDACRDRRVVRHVEFMDAHTVEIGEHFGIASSGDDVVAASSQLDHGGPTNGAPGPGYQDSHRADRRRSRERSAARGASTRGAQADMTDPTSQNHHTGIAVCPWKAWEHREMEKGTVLVVEDEPNIADLVDLYLSREGYRVVKKANGEDGLAAVRDQRPRLVVLDVGLPDLDGLEVCRRIRATSALPIIFLTARADEIDRGLGLELGADDYLTKPFSPAELVARVKAVLRRTDGPQSAEILQAGSVVVDVGRREIRIDDVPIDFTTKEFELLRFLADRPGLAMSRQQILDNVWGHDWYGDERTVDVHIAEVRKKLGDSCTISTVRGIGYRLEPAPR